MISLGRDCLGIGEAVKAVAAIFVAVITERGKTKRLKMLISSTSDKPTTIIAGEAPRQPGVAAVRKTVGLPSREH